jgi:phage gpG-like protein
MSIDISEITNELNKRMETEKEKILNVMEIEAKKAIDRNFETEGHGAWAKKKKPDGRKTLQGKTGNLMRTSAVKDSSRNMIIISSNLLAKAYARIQQEGGEIQRKAEFRTKRNGRSVFARSGSGTKSKSFKIVIPARPYLVISPDDVKRILEVIRGMK